MNLRCDTRQGPSVMKLGASHVWRQDAAKKLMDEIAESFFELG